MWCYESNNCFGRSEKPQGKHTHFRVENHPLENKHPFFHASRIDGRICEKFYGQQDKCNVIFQNTDEIAMQKNIRTHQVDTFSYLLLGSREMRLRFSLGVGDSCLYIEAQHDFEQEFL